jgi:tRNA-dihydrouridine synthase 3
LFEKYGECPYGLSCRFGSSHVKLNPDTDTYENLINQEKRAVSSQLVQVYNALDSELKAKLWKKKYDFGRSDKIVRVAHDYVYANRNVVSTMKYNNNKGVMQKKADEMPDANKPESAANNNNNNNDQKKIGPVTDEDLIKLRTGEKKKIDWKNKLYLAPLTTVISL